MAAFRAHLALTRQDLPRVIALAEEALKLLPEGDFARCEAAVALGGAYWGQGDVAAAQAAFAQGRATALKSGYPPLAVPSACYVGVQQIKQGRLHEAYAAYRQALDWASNLSGARQPVAAFPLIRLGDLAREWNDLPAAQRDLSAGVELCPQLGQADVMAEGQVLLARLQCTLGDHAGARASLEKVEEITRATAIDPWIAAWADQCRLRLWLAAGDWAAANRWAEASGLRPDGALSYQHDLHHINLARLLVARGQADPGAPELAAGLALLARLQGAAQRAGWVHEELQILLLLAQGQQAAGQPAAALAALQRALALAEPGSYLRIFLDEGPALLPLLRQAAGRGIAPAQIGWILAAGDAAPLSMGGGTMPWA
jgi:LuxR family maltose regulon positive regulatory protein